MQDSNIHRVQHSRPRSPRKVRRNSGDDTDGDVNDGYGDLCYEGESDEDVEFFELPMTPVSMFALSLT